MFVPPCSYVAGLLVAVACLGLGHVCCGYEMTTGLPPSNTTINPNTTISPNVTVNPNVTVLPPQPPVVAGDWTVTGTNGKICMRMGLSLQMNITYSMDNGKENVLVVDVHPSTDVASDCSSPFREFNVYPFGRLQKDWSITLGFERKSEGFAFTDVGADWLLDGHFVNSSVRGWGSGDQQSDNFMDQTVALGKSYNCTKPLFLTLSTATIRIAHMHFQPFAEEAGGKYGEAQTCGTHSGGSNAVTAIIVVVVVLCVIVIVAISVYVYKKKRKARVPYGNLTNTIA